MWAGSWKDRPDKPYGLQWVKDLPLLRATFNIGNYHLPTWEPAVAKLEARLSAWSRQSLSFQGKTVVINTLALSQIWHLCHVFPIPRWASTRITKAVWSFFWSGKKDLVKQSTVCLPKSQGGFGVINFEQKAQAFALQRIKRYFDPEQSKWKKLFTFFVSSGLQFDPSNTLARHFVGRRFATLPSFYQIIFHAWQALDGSLSNDNILVLDKHSAVPLALENFSSRTISSLLWQKAHVEPHCQAKFRLVYGPLHWPQTWDQLHICTLDRPIIDPNWKIAHRVLSTGARLAYDFHVAHVSPRCFCDAEDETLAHRFF